MASQGPSSCGWPNEQAEARDLFTTMPSEILLKIATRVPSKYLLDLVQTCRMLRNFIKINASRICNEKIRSEFEFEAKLLQAEMHSGWLVPTNPRVKVEETKYSQYLILGGQWLRRSSDTSGCFHLLGEVKEESTIGLSMTTPGPQFLHFLEQGLLNIRSNPGEKLFRLFGVPVPYRFPARERVVVDGKTYDFAFSADQGWDDPSNFWDFMDGFNRCVLQVEDEQLVARESEGREWGLFPRELIWFYGVERLRIAEEGEAEDWKKLPMLLWE